MAECRGCGKPIKWIKMKTGGNMPVDAKQVKIIRVNQNGLGEVVGGYVAHWSTCDVADNFRPRDKRQFAKP